MLSPRRWPTLVLAVAAHATLISGQGMVKIPASFQAVGQAYTVNKCSPEARSSESGVASEFRESYLKNANTGHGRASLVIDLGVMETVRYIEDEALNQTVQISSQLCSRVDADMVNTFNFHLLKGLNGSMVFPIRQMLSMPPSNERPVTGTCRGMPCITWTYRRNPVKRTDDDGAVIETIDVYYAVWTDFTEKNSWYSMSAERNVPIELRMCRQEKVRRPDENRTEITEQLNVMEIMQFTHEQVNAEDLEYPDGVYCEGFAAEEWKPDASPLNYLSYLAEVTVDAKNDRAVADSRVRMDTTERLYRIDFSSETSSINEFALPQGVKSVNRIISGTHELVFDIQHLKRGVTRCQNRTLRRLPFMMESIIEFQDVPNLSPTLFFGTDRTKYFLKKQTRKRGIPCNVWQGKRTDWPSRANITTVWEWCVGEQKEKQTFGMWDSPSLPLVSLEIYNAHTDDTAAGSEGSTDWEKLTFSFYRVDRANKWVTDLQAFDVTDCMGDNVYPMQFELAYPEAKHEDVVSIAAEPIFLAMCKSEIVRSLKSNLGTLRIGRLRAVFDEQRKMYIQFSLLDGFPSVRDEPTLEKMKASLQKAVDEGSLNVKVNAPGKKEEIEFTAVPNTLRITEDEFPEGKASSASPFQPEEYSWLGDNTTVLRAPPALFYRYERRSQSALPKNDTFAKTVKIASFAGGAVLLFIMGALVGAISLRLQRIVR
ncbi:uncharacterized protein LOC119172273 [Rhipicephalus microplus]|uniref:uncharacterized protein LOC119172273 n=1 Tax=Rhipicephalus microplus TaxID=6941 RepID=UPI003F6CC0C2